MVSGSNSSYPLGQKAYSLLYCIGMAIDSRMKIRKLLHTYDISHSMSALIMPLREAERRGISLQLQEAPGLASKITGYDALFSTGLSKDYVDKREFNLFVSIRELLQNALDEEEVNFQSNSAVSLLCKTIALLDNS